MNNDNGVFDLPINFRLKIYPEGGTPHINTHNYQLFHWCIGNDITIYTPVDYDDKLQYFRLEPKGIHTYKMLDFKRVIKPNMIERPICTFNYVSIT